MFWLGTVGETFSLGGYCSTGKSYLGRRGWHLSSGGFQVWVGKCYSWPDLLWLLVVGQAGWLLEIPSRQHFCYLKPSLAKLLWSFEGDNQHAGERDFYNVLFYLNCEKAFRIQSPLKKLLKELNRHRLSGRTANCVNNWLNVKKQNTRRKMCWKSLVDFHRGLSECPREYSYS